jgi:hypothetical protein
MNTIRNNKVIFVSNLNGEFDKFFEMFIKIKEKSGAFDLIILTGNVFNAKKDFSSIKELTKLNTKILIFDESEAGIVCKHQLLYTQYDLLENITILGRSGIYSYNDLTIAYLNGAESKKYLQDVQKFKYTSNYFSKEDIDRLIDQQNKIDVLLVNTITSIFYDEMRKYLFF